MNIELYIIPLGNNKFQPLVVRDGTVSLEQLNALVGNDGLALQLVKVDDFGPETIDMILNSETKTEEGE